MAPWQITWSATDQSPDPTAILLSRASFGPKPGQVEQVRRIGIDQWIEQQLHPETIDDNALERMLAGLPTLTMAIPQLVEQYQPKSKPGPRQVVFELQKAALLRAIHSERQLLEVMVDFWTNHFNIFIQKDQCKLLKTIDDREVVRKHALGHFQDLLTASAQSPAMLDYLDNRSNVKGVPNENYARELLELHTLGVDGGYTQEDVLEVARCLTGWTYRLRGADPGFVFDRTKLDMGAKMVLGVSIPANGGIKTASKCSRSSPSTRPQPSLSLQNWCAVSSAIGPPPSWWAAWRRSSLDRVAISGRRWPRCSTRPNSQARLGRRSSGPSKCMWPRCVHWMLSPTEISRFWRSSI